MGYMASQMQLFKITRLHRLKTPARNMSLDFMDVMTSAVQRQATILHCLDNSQCSATEMSLRQTAFKIVAV